MLPSSPRCPGPLSRRGLLKLIPPVLGGLGGNAILPLKLRAVENEAGRSENAVIVVWLPGGPPHMEMYDLKPDAPSEYRGEFRPIQTVVPGLDVCEHLPLHARTADRWSVIRSISHLRSDHGGALKYVLAGREPRFPEVTVNEYPMVGSMIARAREAARSGVPPYVSVVDAGGGDVDDFSLGASYLGVTARPFRVAGDPSRADFEVENLSIHPRLSASLAGRMRLLADLGKTRGAWGTSGATDANDVFQSRAIELLTAEKARSAFDVSSEHDAVRERYGMHAWGQRALLARRMVEAGASCVMVTMLSPTPNQPGPANTTANWDSHAVNCNIFTDSRWRLCFYDQAITALIEDLYARGLDRRVMLVVTGEFGRTPRISYAAGLPGRDHWPQAMSVLVSGGGLRMGQAIGATNAKGEYPQSRVLTPNDLWATMFHHLGIDYQQTSFLDHSGRPMPVLSTGEPIAGLL